MTIPKFARLRSKKPRTGRPSCQLLSAGWEGEGFEILEHDGPVIRMDTQFQAIEPDRRIIFSYRLAIGEAPMSVSLATIEITLVDGGSKPTFTEQGAYFGDPAAVVSREEGTRGLLESLAAELDRPA